jgi:hypothetical protein
MFRNFEWSFSGSAELITAVTLATALLVALIA